VIPPMSPITPFNADFRGAKSPHSPIRAWQHFSRRMGDLSSVL
jgi:hypothetical protein